MTELDQYRKSKGLLVRKIVDEAFNCVAGILHSADEYVLPKSSSALSSEVLAEAKPISGRADLKYYASGGQVKYVIEGNAYYEGGSNLRVIDGARPGRYGSFSAEAWEALPFSTKMALNADYEFDLKTGTRTLKEVWKGHYLEINGGVYKKLWPEKEDRFPQLSEDTLIRLKQRYTRIASDPTFAAELKKAYNSNQSIIRLPEFAVGKFDLLADWPIGEPFIDIQGRLVEPPEGWKVLGKNWPGKNNRQ